MTAWKGHERPSVAGRAPSRIRHCSDCPPRQRGGNVLATCAGAGRAKATVTGGGARNASAVEWE